MSDSSPSRSLPANLAPDFYQDPGEDLHDLLPQYLQKRILDIEQIKSLLKESNFVEVRKIAHKIKGHAQSYGLPVLGNFMNKMQTFQDSDFNNLSSIEAELDKMANQIKLLVEYFSPQ